MKKRVFDKKTHAYGVAFVVLSVLIGITGLLNIAVRLSDTGLTLQQRFDHATPVALMSSFACLACLFIGRGLKAESHEDPAADIF